MPPKNTNRAYEIDVKAFRSFLNLKEEEQLPSDPIAAIVRYLLQLQSEGRSYSTIERRLYGISRAYVLRDDEPPAKNPYVRKTISDIRNSGDIDIERHGKRPLTETGARAIIVALGNQLVDYRNRAIIALTFAGGLKRGQLAQLSVDDVEFAGDSLIVHINRQRVIGDDSGRDQRTIDPYPERLLDPADAVDSWLKHAGIAHDHGPLLRRIDFHGNLQEKGLSPEAIGDVVQRCVAAARLKGVDHTDIGTESLRLGLIVTLSSRGVDVASIAKRTGHHETVHLKPLIASAKRAGARKVDRQVVFVD